MSQSASDPFTGTWQLVPAESHYQFGPPPRRATYTIQAEGAGYAFRVEWMDAAGRERTVQFSGIPDGQEYPYENPAIADTVTTTRVDDRTLDTTAKRGGIVIQHARRVLSDDGRRMMVTQSGPTPGGGTYRNVAVYERFR